MGSQASHVHAQVTTAPDQPGRVGRLRRPRSAQALDEDEQHRDEKHGDQRGGEHARDHHRAEDAPRRSARSARRPERHAAEDEGERRHQDRPEPQLCTFERGGHDVEAMLDAQLGELDNQDRVLRRQADQHDDADLRVDVVVEAPQRQPGERPEHRNRHGQQDGERQRPALVKGCENQEHEADRKRVYRPGRARRPSLLVRQVGVVEPELRREGLAQHFFDGVERLPRAVAGRRAAGHLRRAIDVESIRVLRPPNFARLSAASTAEPCRRRCCAHRSSTRSPAPTALRVRPGGRRATAARID